MEKGFLDMDYGQDDEESETEFRPAQEAGSDDEDIKDDEDQKPNTNSLSLPNQQNGIDRKASRSPAMFENVPDRVDDDDDPNGEDDEGKGEDLGNADDEDDEEDEEDEEDEDDEIATGRPRKRRRRGMNQFIEEEAEVDEDDDDDEGEDDIAETGFIQDAQPDDEVGPEEGDLNDDRRHRELDRQREEKAAMDAEALVAELKERHGRRQATSGGMARGNLVPQNLLMPSVDDPSIYSVKCKPGKEREVIASVMKKIQMHFNGKDPLRIMSCFERGGGPMAGYVFVEARKKTDVEHALNGVADVYVRSNCDLIPVKEMPDLLRVTKSKVLKPGEYVRVKRGLYGGDLAQIEEVDDNTAEVVLRIVPRLNYGVNDEDPRNGPEKRKRAAFAPASTPVNRPAPRLFNEAEAKKEESKRAGRILQRTPGMSGRNWTYKNDIYEMGFLIKSFKRNQLEVDNVGPKLEEITRLTRTEDDGAETLDLEQLAHSIRNASGEGTYVPGDEVEVFSGEQKGTIGRIEGVTGQMVKIRVSDGELAGSIVDQPVKDVRKRFREGDHVKVIGSSRYAGEVGMVIKITDDRVTVLTDTSMEEITVFSKDLREAVEAGGSDVKSTGLDVQDLVSISATEIGIVVKSDREACRVLDENGSIVQRLPSQLQKIEPQRNAVSTDRNGAEIRIGDMVRENGGEAKSGRILHINKGYVFVHDRQRLENSGLWTTRSMNIIAIATKNGTTSAGPDLSKLNPAIGGTVAAAMAPPPQRPGRDRLIGNLVHIRKGPYKGHKGLVKDTTADSGRIELQSKNKVINLPKDFLAVVDKVTGKTVPYAEFAHSRGPPFRNGASIPSHSRVPDPVGFAGGRTPAAVADGGRTPAWGASSARTPAWKPSNGAATSYGGAGGMTSYGGAGNLGAGSRTPAWSSTARTPYNGEAGYSSANGGSGFDAFNAGSRTPYGGNTSSRTPAWGGGASANTVSGYSAPTPVQRAYDAPTPGAGLSAPTPNIDNNNGSYTSYGGYNYNSSGNASMPAQSNPAPIPTFAKGSNKDALPYNRLQARDEPQSQAQAVQTPSGVNGGGTSYGGYGGYDAPTPAAQGPRYADDDDD